MSENVDRVRAGYEAFNRGDYEAATELMHPEIVWYRPDRSLDPEPVRGVEAVRELMLPEVFDRQRLSVDEMLENERTGQVLVSGRFRVRGRGSGIELETRSYQVWTLRDGRALRCENFNERPEALAAAGLD